MSKFLSAPSLFERLKRAIEYVSDNFSIPSPTLYEAYYWQKNGKYSSHLLSVLKNARIIYKNF
jgi:hypothetical protein